MYVAARPSRVADRLVRLREDLGITQEEAVARTAGGITYRQWQRWEAGESQPYKRNLAKLSEVFDIPIVEFFEGSTDASQFDRIERKLDLLLRYLAAAKLARPSEPPEDYLADMEQELDEAVAEQEDPPAVSA